MEQITACEVCETEITPRMVGGHAVRTCSPECSAINAKVRRKMRYAQNREQAIADARRWVLENREHVRERDRRFREANKDAIRRSKEEYRLANLEKIKARQAAWYQANRERIRAEWCASQTAEDRAIAAERARQWAEANPERRAEWHRQWAKANPEKVAVARHRRRARLKGIPADDVTVVDLMIAQDFTCYLCNGPMDPELKKPHPLSPSIDHIVPIARGGTSLRENLAAAHLGCNCAKGAKLLDLPG